MTERATLHEVKCPGCSCGDSFLLTTLAGHKVYVCSECGGVHGHVPAEVADRMVLRASCGCSERDPQEFGRYYDFSLVNAENGDSGALRRRHGWYCEICRGVVQAG